MTIRGDDGSFSGGWSQTEETTATTIFGKWKFRQGGTTVKFVFVCCLLCFLGCKKKDVRIPLMIFQTSRQAAETTSVVGSLRAA